jgi:hypothetical protein
VTYTVLGNPAYKFGNTSRLWGSDAANDPVVYWAIEIDWTNSGAYDGSNEAQYCIDMEVTRGRNNRLTVDSNGNADGFSLSRIGTARIVFDNSSRRYDPYYTSGALYGYILPGRYIKIRATYHGVTYPVFHGNIKSINPVEGENPTVILECEDGMRLIQNATSNLSISLDVNPEDAVGAILTELEWPTRFGTDLQAYGVQDIAYFWTSGNALNEIKDICKTRPSNFWIAATGAATNYSILFTNGTMGTTISESNTLKQIALPVPWEEIKNYFKSYYTPRVIVTATPIFTLGETPLISATGNETRWGDYTYNNEQIPAINIITPVATTDFTANTLADGTGTDLTASFSVAVTDFGDNAKIVISNNHATLAGFITFLQVRGDAVTTQGRGYQLNVEAESVTKYQRHDFVVDSKFVQNYYTANNMLNYSSHLRSNRPNIEVQIDARPDMQFDADLFKLVPVDIAKYTIDEDRTIGYINHKWVEPNGQRTVTTLILEVIPTQPPPPFI